MHRNVMSRNLARRFGAYANKPRIADQHARPFTSSARSRHPTAAELYEHNRAHRESLAFLQEEERRHMVPLTAHLGKYIKVLEDSQKTFDRIPVLPQSENMPSRAKQEARIAHIHRTAATLKDRLEQLRLHLEDLEREPYPTLEELADQDIEWEFQVRAMGPEERKDVLANLELEAAGDRLRVSDTLQRIRAQQGRSNATVSQESSSAPAREANSTAAAAVSGKPLYMNPDEMAGEMADEMAQPWSGSVSPVPSGPLPRPMRMSVPEDEEKAVVKREGMENYPAAAGVPANAAESERRAPVPVEQRPRERKFGDNLHSLQAKLEMALKQGRS